MPRISSHFGAAGEKPHDLIAGSCSLRNRTLSSLLKDYHIKEMLESTGQLLPIVTTPEDLAILISFGVPAAPAGGLDFNELHGPRLNRFRKLLRLREWGWGPGSAELEAEAQSPTDSAVDESPGTAGAPATAEPQAAVDDVEDESADAGEAEDSADEQEDESAEAGEAEDPADGLEDESAAAAKVKDSAKAFQDEFYGEGDWFGTGEGDDPANEFKEQFLALQREQAEQDARMEKRMREDKSISLVLLNGSLSRLEPGDVPEILQIRDQLSVVEEYAKLEMGGLRRVESESQIPPAAPIFRAQTGPLPHRRHLAGRARQGVFDAGRFGERSAAGAHVVCGGCCHVDGLNRLGCRPRQERELESGPGMAPEGFDRSGDEGG